jgi:virginiamycin B lyase
MDRSSGLFLLRSAVLVLSSELSGAAVAAELSGQVMSAEEGAMEGVLVTARKAGSNISVTVVSDENGHYRFPDGRLETGDYRLRIRAAGYALQSNRNVSLDEDGAVADLTLVSTEINAYQLTNTEWLMSMPGPESEKRYLYGCTVCHQLNLPLSSTYNAEQIVNDLVPRMAAMSSQSVPGKVQTRLVESGRGGAPEEAIEHLATYLASVNLSTRSKWDFPLQTLPRPSGEATHVIITSYELPYGDMQPHDSVRGPDGYVWVSDFGGNRLTRLDPDTGETKVFAYEALRPEGYATGNLDVEFDEAGNIWLGMMNQTGVAMFDRHGEEFTFYPLPDHMVDERSQQAMVSPTHSSVDGKVWINDADHPFIGRLDLASGTFEEWMHPFAELPLRPRHGAYGLYTDTENNAYLLDFPSENIWRVDARTGVSTRYPTPTRGSRPRRGRIDSQGRLFFAEYGAGNVGMFDTKTNDFAEWPVPGPYSMPYDAQHDEHGWVWTNNTMDDRVTRINIETGETIQYLMPIEANGRRVSIDNSGPRPALWMGSNHRATVMRVEPLE